MITKPDAPTVISHRITFESIVALAAVILHGPEYADMELSGASGPVFGAPGQQPPIPSGPPGTLGEAGEQPVEGLAGDGVEPWGGVDPPGGVKPLGGVEPFGGVAPGDGGADVDDPGCLLGGAVVAGGADFGAPSCFAVFAGSDEAM